MAWIVCLLRRSWLCDELTKICVLVLALCYLIAMFGIGAHYLIDLVVGFAFANCIGGLLSVQLSWKNTARRHAILFGGILCVGWYIIILFGLPSLQLSIILAWCIFLSSILVSFYLEWNLFREQSRHCSITPHFIEY
jgi:hypothetical protein